MRVLDSEMANTGLGFGLLLVSAVCGGLYTTPMGVVKTGWSFEATWFLYSLLADIVFPWIVALLTVPDLFGVYSEVAGSKILLVAVFGSLWGIGCQLFGLGISMVGNSLGFALILGLAATLGSVIPLVALHPDEVGSRSGIFNFTGLGLAIIALVATAIAGVRKEQDSQAAARQLIQEARLVPKGPDNNEGNNASTDDDGAQTKDKASFTTGVFVCVFSGVFSACLNLANSFGKEISDKAVEKGAASSMGTNAIFAISIACGGVPNLIYCGYIMLSKGECPWSHGYVSGVKALLTTAVMGVLWFGSNVSYGVATTQLPGDLGTEVGWPIYIIGMVLVANISGVVTGEWKLAGRTARAWMGVGLSILCLAIVAVGLAA